VSHPLQFSPTRLKIARQLAGLKQIELAELVGITPPALSQYEHGLHAPSPLVLQKVAFSLGFPRAFFHGGATAAPLPAFFRSLRSTPQRERDRAAAYAWLVARVVEAVELHVKLPRCDLRLESGIPSAPTRADIEQAAALVRAQLGVPRGPVANVVRLLEAHGAAVATFADGDPRLSAFSQWHGHRPIVVLCLGAEDKARRRYDAAHELGHLALHCDPEPGNNVLEQQADEFASAFLMPAEDIAPFLPQGRVQWAELEKLKRVWGVSLQALIVRAHRLGRISDRSYQQAFHHISRQGWRRNEPVDLGPPEEPQLLARAFALLEKKGLKPEEVLRALALPESLARLAEVGSTGDEPGASVVPLKPRPPAAPATPERRLSTN
jgi:Zn-dependent peptidase ImmA (M78 family)/transcriptional regulator with XRE-family HTH domain